MIQCLLSVDNIFLHKRQPVVKSPLQNSASNGCTSTPTLVTFPYEMYQLSSSTFSCIQGLHNKAFITVSSKNAQEFINRSIEAKTVM